MNLNIDAKRLTAELEQLAAFSSSPPPGVTRVLWSDVDVAARAFVRARCREAGLAVREDALGTMFARLEGQDPTLAPVATGSHIDAIPDAGRYDGTVGVLGGLEALRALKQSGVKLRRPVELIMFTAEEPTRFGVGCLGSRAMCGALTPAALVALQDRDGRTLDELRVAAGFSGNLAEVQLAPGSYAAFVELHIEQGPILEAEHIPIGVVEAIAAPASLRLVIEGEGGHAGAVLMPGRRDALLAAAEIALAVERAALATGSPDTVATTGVLRVEPGAINSIPSRARLEIDVRDIRPAPRDQALDAIRTSVREICERRGVRHELTLLNSDPPATSDPSVVAAIEHACADAGALPFRRMASRAYHDTLFMAQICPAAMIFTPCRGGVSHRPDEYAAPEAIARGALVLAHALVQLAR
jgi:N-carbamoyl-L-amino-acid hydrolase